MTTTARPLGAPDPSEQPAAGVWTLAGDRLIIAEAEGPATMLVPTEQVRLIAVDLPLPNRAKRLAALPFAIEDRIAEPLDTLHIVLGAEVAPKRYLVGVVRHEVMAGWVAAADAAGLGHAAIVPDALALPTPGESEWSVDLGATRAVVRAGDGTGFAVVAPLLHAAWEAAGRPRATGYGAPLPEDMAGGEAGLTPGPLAARLLAPALDLREGIYARRRVSQSTLWRRLGWIVAIGAAAHIGIAAADTLMLRTIAERRAADTRALAAIAAPGANLGDDLAASVTDLLPASGPAAAPDRFLPLVTRISAALAPLSGAVSVRAMNFQGNALTFDLDGSDASLPGRIEAALRGAGVTGQVTRSPDGAIRITANVQ